MGKCKICTHTNRDEIDAALLSGESLRDIAGRFNVSKTGLARHKAGHLPSALVKAQEIQEMVKADDLLVQVRGLQKRALGILAQAEAAGDLRTAVAAIREARGNLELLAKLLGELQAQPTYNILITSPEWLTLRVAILKALEPYPAARLALVEALHGFNSDSEGS